MSQPIIEIDIHGLMTQEAKERIDKILSGADNSVYRIKIIHGFNRGNKLQKMIYDEYEYFGHKKVKRVVGGNNPGITELVLREY